MKTTSSATLLLVACLSVSMPVNAVVVTETWESTVTGANHSAFSVGDTFQWTVTFDNMSDRMHRWDDGPNALAEHGGGDDILSSTHHISSYSGYTFFSDAVFDITDAYAPLAAVGFTGDNLWWFNYAQAFSHENGHELREFMADDTVFTTYIFWTYYVASDGRQSYTQTYIASRLVGVASAVPEPSILALLALGLAGVGFSSRKTRR